MNFLKSTFFVILLSLYAEGFGDSFSWTGKDITTQTGSLSNIKGAEKIKYKFGYRSGGFGHLESAIKICWHDLEGKKHKQIIFEGMIDWTVKSIKVNEPNSEIRVEFRNPSTPEAGDIFQHDLIYFYDLDKRKFEIKK